LGIEFTSSFALGNKEHVLGLYFDIKLKIDRIFLNKKIPYDKLKDESRSLGKP
jgi:hypothetical protein